ILYNTVTLIHSPILCCGGSGITPCSPLRFGSNPAASHPLTYTLLRWERDSNPRYSFPNDSLANCWFQPLTHPTMCSMNGWQKYKNIPFLKAFFGFFLTCVVKFSVFAADCYLFCGCCLYPSYYLCCNSELF
ncbi:MAG: hypothetical protein RL164_136, partial [Bacteroidota bacterium]